MDTEFREVFKTICLCSFSFTEKVAVSRGTCNALYSPVWLLFEWGCSPRAHPKFRIVLKFENRLTQHYWNSLIFVFILKAINPDTNGHWDEEFRQAWKMAPFPCRSCWEWVTFGRSEDICHSTGHSQAALEVGVEMGWTSSSIVGDSTSKHYTAWKQYVHLSLFQLLS